METGINTLSGNYKIVSTLPEKTLKTHKTAHFDTNSQCILMLDVVNCKNESVWTVF